MSFYASVTVVGGSSSSSTFSETSDQLFSKIKSSKLKENLKNNLKENMSRKGSRKMEVFELMEVQEFLGQGSFGKVAKCAKLGSPECYAIKIMKSSWAGEREFKMMKLIKDLDPDENHLIKMYEWFPFQNMTCIVYELLDVNLHDSLMNEMQMVHLCWIRVIAQHLLKALKALKSIGVAHCDIKLDNIMFAELDSVNVKLIDFGLAVETKKLSTETEIQVTPFRAPEVILGLPLDESVDMWALGMVLASVYFGNYPFPSEIEYETIRAMVQIFGLPEAEVLHKAKNKAAFFTRDNSDWRLCTPEEYTETTGEQVETDHLINLDAAYAGKAGEVMGKTQPSEAQVNPSASSSSSMSGSSNKNLQTDKDKAIESRKGKRKTKVFKLMEGHCLDGNQGIYKVQEFLGNGSFGNVVKCTKLGSQECYAIKIMNCSRAGQEEFETMKLIKDLDPDENHLIKMFECFTFHSVTCIVYELLDVSLFDSYKRDSSTRTHLCLIRVIAQQLLKALKALKSIGVAHCDITLDNIMFTDPDSVNVKLIDFGLAVETKKLSTETDIQVTPFRAPEVILGLPLDESVDMWALGVVLACVYFGNYPFPSETEYETIRAMVQIFGLPEAEVLHKAKNKAAFFTRDNSDWRLCTPEEYTETTGEQVEIKNHVINLDAMIHEHRDMFNDHDDDDHRAFIDLLKNMLEVNPKNRITPLGCDLFFFVIKSASKNPSSGTRVSGKLNWHQPHHVVAPLWRPDWLLSQQGKGFVCCLLFDNHRHVAWSHQTFKLMLSNQGSNQTSIPVRYMEAAVLSKNFWRKLFLLLFWRTEQRTMNARSHTLLRCALHALTPPTSYRRVRSNH
uniref:Protein kinase domain-containing protein n=1 Tax=Oryzias latipes TaxID=8090 RepID=A0A3P9KRS0_ORYLA